MLILSRHNNERIMIGDDIVITVIEINGARPGMAPRVRFGIEAPAGIAVDREEVRKAKERNRGPENPT